MTQTTDKFSMAATKVEVSTDGSSWTDISGQAQKVESTAQIRKSGEAYTFDGDTALVCGGKREPIEVTVTIIYNEESDEAFDLARAEFEADDGDAYYVKWTPGGGTGGDYTYSTGAGEIVSFKYPDGDAGSGDPVICEFTIKTAELTVSSVAT